MTTESEIKARIDASLRELLDLSLRNRLLNYRTTRGRGVSVTGENPMQVFDTLVRKRRRMSFLARPGQHNVGEEDLLVQPELESRPIRRTAVSRQPNRLLYYSGGSSTHIERPISCLKSRG